MQTISLLASRESVSKIEVKHLRSNIQSKHRPSVWKKVVTLLAFSFCTRRSSKKSILMPSLGSTSLGTRIQVSGLLSASTVNLKSTFSYFVSITRVYAAFKTSSYKIFRITNLNGSKLYRNSIKFALSLEKVKKSEVRWLLIFKIDNHLLHQAIGATDVK